MMTKKAADKKAKADYGPTAGAVRSSNIDRNQRFGIAFYEPPGAFEKPVVMVLGYGDSFDAAFKMAETNEAAKAVAMRWAKIQEDWKSFGENPAGFFEKAKESL